MIFNMGIPNVNDLCVEQNIKATISAFENPNDTLFVAHVENMRYKKLNWISRIRSATINNSSGFTALTSLAKVSQNVV